MNDTIGFMGMHRGWAMPWYTCLLWLLPMLLVSVAMVALVESLISTLRARRSPSGPQRERMRGEYNG